MIPVAAAKMATMAISDAQYLKVRFSMAISLCFRKDRQINVSCITVAASISFEPHQEEIAAKYFPAIRLHGEHALAIGAT
jgi:hypothetical protein